MKLQDLAYPRFDELIGAPDDVRLKRILDATNGNVRTIEQVLRENSSTEHQTPNRVVPVKLTHGIEEFIANPFPGKRRCAGAWVINCDGGQRVSGSVDVRNATLGGESQIGITAYFAPPDGVCAGYRNAALSLANSATLVFDTSELSEGDLSINTSSGSITCAKAGVISVDYVCVYNVSAGGAYRGASIITSDDASMRMGRFRIPSNGATAAIGGASTRFAVSAGATILIAAEHDTGGTVPIGVGASRQSRISAQYADVLPGTAANVTLYLFAE